MNISLFWLRIMGITGMLGGLILFAGDMLFFYQSGSTDLMLNMGMVEDNRIILSGVTALFGAWFYVFGLGQIYFAFKPTTSVIRNLSIVCFAAIFMSYGIIHGAFVAIGTSAKLAVEHQLDLKTSIALAFQANDVLRLFIYPIFALVSLIFFHQVWKGKTLYPRWILIFYPLLPFALQNVVDDILSGDLWLIIMSGYLNLIMFVFYLASTIALWNAPTDN